jgi:DNA replication protein DnaC
METAQPQTPPSNSSPATVSGPYRLGATLQGLESRWLAPETPEQRERDRRNAEEAQRREDDTERRRRGGLFSAFLGDRTQYEQCKLENWVSSKEHSAKQAPVLAAVRDYCADIPARRSTGEGCLFYGPPGTGKDYLATVIVRKACLEHGIDCKYLNGVEWFVTLRDSMGDDRKTEGSIIRDFASSGFLVLSDPLPPFGDLSAYQAQMLYRLIDERTVRKLPTIVTINVKDREEAVRRVGGATWDRIRNGAWVFACNWPSFRKPARVVGEP